MKKKLNVFATEMYSVIFAVCQYFFSRLLQKFLSDTKTLYKAELETVDFISNADAARLNINTWVEKQTHGAKTSFKIMLR